MSRGAGMPHDAAIGRGIGACHHAGDPHRRPDRPDRQLTRSDEEVTVAFRDPQIGRKTVLASLAGLDLIG